MLEKLTADEPSQFVDPRGAYFLFVDISRINIPSNYAFPEYIAARGRDFKFTYWMINEIGVSCIPGSCKEPFSTLVYKPVMLIKCPILRLLRSHRRSLG